MNRDYKRSDRVADQIQRELAELIRTEVKDPRVSSLTTVSHVDVTRDLSLAKVYVSVLDESAREGTVEALSRAAGFLRKQLAARLRLRAVPEVRFAYDEALDRGNRLDDLISDAVRSDRRDDD